MKDIFISYAHEDRETARELAELLEAAGLTVWWDPQLRAGEDFAQIIEQTLQQVRCVIVLWSRESVESHWVRAEANEGLRLAKLVPVVLDDAIPPLIFRALHTVRLERSDLHTASAGLQKLIDDVRVRLGETPAPRPPVSGRLPALAHHWPLLLGGAVTLVAVAAVGGSGLGARGLDALTGLFGEIAGLAPIAVEVAIALAATVALFAVAYRDRRRLRRYAVYALAFVVGSIGYAWIERWRDPPPDHLFGRVIAQAWGDLSVSAIDAAGRETALQAVPVSSTDGSFGMRLHPVFADRPRFVVVRRPGCREVREKIDWEAWRDRKDVLIDFSCE